MNMDSFYLRTAIFEIPEFLSTPGGETAGSTLGPFASKRTTKLFHCSSPYILTQVKDLRRNSLGSSRVNLYFSLPPQFEMQANRSAMEFAGACFNIPCIYHCFMETSGERQFASKRPVAEINMELAFAAMTKANPAPFFHEEDRPMWVLREYRASRLCPVRIRFDAHSRKQT